MTITSLESTDFDTIFKGFSEAFSDYDIQINADELKAMWKRRGFRADLSFGAFEGTDMVSCTFNGVGDFNGVRMAYDTGTGTVKAHRGQGLATRIFEHSIPFLKAAHIDSYLLEVLQHNTKAVALYQKIGFEVTREFNYFVWKSETLQDAAPNAGGHFSIAPVDIEAYDDIADFWDFYPSWQNSIESIRRAPGHFIQFGAFADQKLVGYCVFTPLSGDVTQIAVDKAFRRRGIGSLLLQEAARHNQHPNMKLVNTDVTCEAMTDFLKSKNIAVTGRQFEMVKPL